MLAEADPRAGSRLGRGRSRCFRDRPHEHLPGLPPRHASRGAELNPAPDYLLVDAVTVDLPVSQRALIHGDALSQCIAAASILAKVERDACMRDWDRGVSPVRVEESTRDTRTDEHWKALENARPHDAAPVQLLARA